MRIIIHIDESKKWPMVLNNLKHLNEHYQDQNDLIEILVNGDAVTELQSDNKMSEQISSSSISTNRLVACQNSLDQRNISIHNLVHNTEIVSSGVVELVEKQTVGYIYLRP